MWARPSISAVSELGRGAQPLPGEIGRHVVAQRADVHEPGPASRSRRSQPVLPCAAIPPASTCVFFCGSPPKATHSSVSAVQRAPRGDLAADHRRGADHVRQQGERGRETVVVPLVGEAAEAVQEAGQLRLGVMEAARARPAVGSAEDRGVPVLFPDPAQFAGHQGDRVRPRHFHELITAAPLGVTARGPATLDAVQPAAADRGLAHPAVGSQRVRYRGEQRGRLRVPGERLDPGQPPVLRMQAWNAPQWELWLTLAGPRLAGARSPGRLRRRGGPLGRTRRGRSLSHMPSGRAGPGRRTVPAGRGPGRAGGPRPGSRRRPARRSPGAMHMPWPLNPAAV